MISSLVLVLYFEFSLIDMASCNPGQCPIFPIVNKHDRACFEEETCKTDHDCQSNQKCCENPCGISKCYRTTPTFMETTERCPGNPQPSCNQMITKFCFRTDCSRCCHHSDDCNPAPLLLNTAEQCYKIICSKYKCPQGSKCHVEESTNEPYCKCYDKCHSGMDYVCGRTQETGVQKTYYNQCNLDRKACERNQTIGKMHKGSCNKSRNPIRNITSTLGKPLVEKVYIKGTIGSRTYVKCYSEKGLQPNWYQKRDDGKTVLLPPSFQESVGVIKIWGKSRKVLLLKIISLGHGSLATYSCKVKFGNTSLESFVHISSTKDEVFSTTDCLLPKDSGTCSGNFDNYYYNQQDKSCRVFQYGGCSGNSNNFKTKHECETKCLNKKPNGEVKLIHQGEQCGKELCQYYADCKPNMGSKQCVCQNTCPFRPDKVCGSDGKTYLTLCAMKSESCKWRKPLVALYKGNCEPFHTRVPPANPKTSQPPSLCDLKNCSPYAKCYVHQITKMPHCYCEEKCTFKPDIVCGSNMEHFLNKCFLEVHSCKLGRMLHVLKKGLCLK